LKSREFNITFLGTSAASINPYSPTSTCLIECGSSRIMVDAGIGALRQLRRLHIDSNTIDAVLITHWHFDHFAGLSALLRSRKGTLLSMYGPKPSTAARIYLLGLLHSRRIRFEAADDSSCIGCGDVRIKAVPTAHGIISFGWVLTERVPAEQSGKRRIAVSGDTRPTQAIINAAQGADLLVHEATYPDNRADTAREHEHSTVTQAADLAVKAGVGALALTHIGHRYPRLSALKEAEKAFPSVLVPSPLDRIYVEPLPDNIKREDSGWGHVRMVHRLTS
jgi:ribonuclease Z